MKNIKDCLNKLSNSRMLSVHKTEQNRTLSVHKTEQNRTLSVHKKQHAKTRRQKPPFRQMRCVVTADPVVMVTYLHCPGAGSFRQHSSDSTPFCQIPQYRSQSSHALSLRLYLDSSKGLKRKRGMQSVQRVKYTVD